MKFLRALLRKLNDWWRGKPARRFDLDPHRPLEPSEAIIRYFSSLSKVNQSTRKLRAEAFVPHPHKEMSVFRAHGLTHRDTRDLGQEEFGNKLTVIAPVLGWGRLRFEVLSDSVIRLRLADWKKSDGAHPRHRDVIGWPQADDVKVQKARQKEIALELSERTQLVMAASS